MASATVAAILGENRNDLVGKMQRRRLTRMNDTDRKSRRHAVAALGRDHRGPISHRNNTARGIEPDNARRLRAPTHLTAHILGTIQGGQQLLPGILRIENQLTRSGPIVHLERCTLEQAGATDHQSHKQGHHSQQGPPGHLRGLRVGHHHHRGKVHEIE